MRILVEHDLFKLVQKFFKNTPKRISIIPNVPMKKHSIARLIAKLNLPGMLIAS